MIGNPGAKFDFGTLIAYLIPGYIIEFSVFCMLDSLQIIFSNVSLIGNINWGVVEVVISGTLLTVLAYILGLLLDMVAHPITLHNEIRQKNEAYRAAAIQFKGFINDREISNILHASDSDKADVEKRNLFIDSMFYRFASPEIWARQNWHWAFYEFTRQMYLLCVPVAAVSGFYIPLALMLVVSAYTDMSQMILVSSVVMLFALLMGLFGIRPLFKRASDMDCLVYYRHRAWVVFAYLIEERLLKKSFCDETKIETQAHSIVPS